MNKTTQIETLGNNMSGIRLIFKEDTPLDTINLSSWIRSGQNKYEIAINWGDGQMINYAFRQCFSIEHCYGCSKHPWDKTITIMGKLPCCSLGDITKSETWENDMLNSFRPWVKKVEVIGKSPFTDIYGTFAFFTSLEEIDENIFENCGNATDADFLFYRCQSMKKYPSKILAPLKNVTTFRKAFAHNKSLEIVPSGFFVENKKATKFGKCFLGTTSLNKFECGVTRVFDNERVVLNDMFRGSALEFFSFKENFLGINCDESNTRNMFANPFGKSVTVVIREDARESFYKDMNVANEGEVLSVYEVGNNFFYNIKTQDATDEESKKRIEKVVNDAVEGMSKEIEDGKYSIKTISDYLKEEFAKKKADKKGDTSADADIKNILTHDQHLSLIFEWLRNITDTFNTNECLVFNCSKGTYEIVSKIESGMLIFMTCEELIRFAKTVEALKSLKPISAFTAIRRLLELDEHDKLVEKCWRDWLKEKHSKYVILPRDITERAANTLKNIASHFESL